MTTLRTAAQQALEALEHVVRQAQENLVPTIHYGPVHDVMNNLRAALAEPVREPTVTGYGTINGRKYINNKPVQEPVATLYGTLPIYDTAPQTAEPVQEPVCWYDPTDFTRTTNRQTEKEYAPLYTSPPQRPAEPVQKPAFHGFMSADGTRVDLCFTPSAPRSDGTYATAYYAAPPQRPAEPVQEPVAWMVYTEDGKSVCVTDHPADFVQWRSLPLYTSPPQRKPLTDEKEPVACIAQILSAFPLLDDEGLDEEKHHCEWTLQQDRKRLHAMLIAPPQRKPLSAIDLRVLYDRYAACQEEGPEISGWWDFARAVEAAHGIKEET